MRRLSILAALGLTVSAAPAFAWGEMGGYVNQFQPTNHEIAIWAYPTRHNYCPAGLQPVVVGGAVCCGTPTHTGYRGHAAPAQRGGYVATGKGFGDGYYEQGSRTYLGN